MTFEELKREAQEQGYNLIPRKPPVVKLNPCTCGKKRVTIYNYWDAITGHYFYRVECPVCNNGENNEYAPTEREAREIWNKFTEGEEKCQTL